MKFIKKEVNGILLLIGILFLLSGCQKNAAQNGIDEKNEITGNVIEDSKENCRLVNESDCSPIEIRKGEAENDDTNNTANAENDGKKTINISEEAELSDCEQGWKCVEPRYRAYQFSNCSWASIEFCVYGCKNGLCNAPLACKPNSLKCDNDNLVKCEDGYEWKLNESCDYQCQNGICVSKNETATNTTGLTNATNSTNTTQGHDFLSDNCISVLNFNYAPAGNNLSQEYFTLKNSCSYQIDMSSWTAKDNSTHVYTFPSFNLDNAAQVKVVTGSGTNDQATLYWGSGIAIWNNNGDSLYLNTSNGTLVLVYSYP